MPLLLGLSRGDNATLNVTAKRILPVSVCQRGDTATLWGKAEGILPLSGLQQRGCCHSLGDSKVDTTTVCLSENTHSDFPSTVYSIYIYIHFQPCDMLMILMYSAQGWASVLFNRMFRSLRSFPFFIKEHSVFYKRTFRFL